MKILVHLDEETLNQFWDIVADWQCQGMDDQ